MTFSIRTFLVVIAILSVWLGALVSKSPLLVELAAGGTVLLILLSLALAIWEPRPLQRAFWTGFFALAFGNLLYNGFFHSYQQTSNQVAQAIMGNNPQPIYSPATYTYPAPATTILTPPAQVSYYAPEGESDESADSPPSLGSPAAESDGSPDVTTTVDEFPRNPIAPTSPNAVPGFVPPPPTLPPTTYIQVPVQAYGGANYYEQREAIRASVPSLISLLMGVVGGCVTMWIASRPKPQ